MVLDAFLDILELFHLQVAVVQPTQQHLYLLHKELVSVNTDVELRQQHGVWPLIQGGRVSCGNADTTGMGRVAPATALSPGPRLTTSFFFFLPVSASDSASTISFCDRADIRA
jgi:hypothetical protein